MALQTTASPTDPLCLGEVRAHFGIPSTQRYCMSDYLRQPLKITTNQKELNLRTWALANGWNGSSAVTIEVVSGVYIWSDNTAVAGLTINGSWPNGITLVNNGFIIGRGGDGGSVAQRTKGAVGSPGGAAISLGVNCIIRNKSYIAGGGGGGGALFESFITDSYNLGGGGGGGAGGGNGTPGSPPTNLLGGPGGAVGQAGNDGNNGVKISNIVTTQWGGAGGGGRILPGVRKGTISGLGGGAGGNGGWGRGYLASGRGASIVHVNGGGGGGWGAAGGTGTYTGPTIVADENFGGLGGEGNNVGGNAIGNLVTYDQNGNLAGVGRAGGTGGKAVALNGYSVTWLEFGTRWGAIS